MNVLSSFKLHTSRITNIPLQNYEEKFTFIVNGKEYLTSKIVADLLSTKISSLHRTDASFDRLILRNKEIFHVSSILLHSTIKKQTNQKFAFSVNYLSSLEMTHLN